MSFLAGKELVCMNTDFEMPIRCASHRPTLSSIASLGGASVFGQSLYRRLTLFRPVINLRAIVLGGLGAAALVIAGCEQETPAAANGETKVVSQPKNGAPEPLFADIEEAPAAANGDSAMVSESENGAPEPMAAAADESAPAQPMSAASALSVALEPAMPMFPWPPPRASASQVVPLQFFADAGDAQLTLGDVERQIREALDATGYFERSYFAVPQGFAMVTRIERINDDGTPKPGDERWSATPGLAGALELGKYLRGLFTARVGRYRAIVFAITPVPFHQSDVSVARDVVEDWLAEGFNVLPASVAVLPFTPGFACTALIYEFEARENQQIANLIAPSQLLGRRHLERAGVWQALQ